ncbi:hypothetical protein [Sphingomonas sp.]|jgi:Holliday junction resolvase-like predicted endonuclease|uniref:hypothetical protein n=1 Tax=Sphingomonas sp. TaxID=28214 RepID=UPI002E31E348|nr:hypothetical protein [Sphingomonas sp.]HEX4694482.1 hypothetical protein [Sphingomonas sp.]
MTDKALQRIVRRLSEAQKGGNLDAVERELAANASQGVFAAIREQKVLAQGGAAIRKRFAEIVSTQLEPHLDGNAAEEYRRYLALVLEIGSLRDQLKAAVGTESLKLPRISLKQLMAVAERTFSREVERAATSRAPLPSETSVSEYERSIHEFSGYANDVMFGVLRALNEVSSRVGGRALRRPDAIERSLGPFRRITLLASQLNGLEYVLDSTSFGECSIAAHDHKRRLFRLELVDLRLTTIRQLAIRRRLIHVATGHRHPRFVREQLAAIQSAFLADAVEEYVELSGSRDLEVGSLEALERRGTLLLNDIDAEDDLIYVSGRGGARIPTLYHVSMALRWSSMAAEHVAKALPGRARRDFGDEVQLSYLLGGLPRHEEREAARLAWNDLTVSLPARSHFEILRRPFVRTGEGYARPARPADMSGWATVVREVANTGGEVGRLFGSVWEEFTAAGFADTGWEIVGRNVSISDGGSKLTEADMLLLRDDLLLVVELKALTGSGITPYDHWKARRIIEKGCRQALLAANTLRDRPKLLSSIVGRSAAARISAIQPLVLSSDGMFDGWSHLGVPVAGETIRKAITVGTKVEIFDGRTLEVVETTHHLRAEDLTTETILRALREPIELKIAPEQGAVEMAAVSILGATFLVPNPTAGETSVA